jgi:hypothetical protein
MLVDEYLSRVIEAYSKDDFYGEIKEARDEFFRATGNVAEGSEHFEAKMNNFLDWYVFDRPLKTLQIAPIKAFVQDHTKQMSEEEKAVFEDFSQSKVSVYELLKIKDNDLYVQDLFDREKYVIEETDLASGFTKGDIFQTRLLRYRERFLLGNAFVFHPREAKSFIQKQIKKIKYLKDTHRLSLLHKLSAMKQKAEQYSHIDVKYIYSDEPIL